MKYIYSTISFFVFSLLIAGNASTASAFDQGRTLKLGSEGNEVKTLQECLGRQGFSFESGADGYFGQETHNAIVKFQQTKGLGGNGIVGPYTLRLLGCGPLSQSGTVATTNALVIPSETTASDTALFNFTLNMKPFTRSIYVPTSARISAEVVVSDGFGKILPAKDQNIIMTSTAPVVIGKDKNSYYQVSKPESFTISASIQPGPGSYQARLHKLDFTSQDVRTDNYFGFIGLSLPLDHSTWTTQSITTTK